MAAGIRSWQGRAIAPLGALLLLAATAGCGNQYRPVVSAINPVGPAAQPTKFAVAISSPSATSAGLVTFVDFSGDSILSTPSILANPSYFNIDASGTYGYTVNVAGVFDDFPLGSPTGLITSDIVQTQLAAGAAPSSVSSFGVGSGSDIFVPEPGLSRVAVLNSPTGPSLVQELSVAANPIYVVGANSAQRVYAISQGTVGANGVASSIEGTPLSVSSTIQLGVNPVYGVMTFDDRRAFILNNGSATLGSGTVSVINVINNALDSTPTITIPNIVIPGGGMVAPRPIWADLSPRTGNAASDTPATAGNNQLVVLNQGDGVHPGTLTIISIPLCNPSALNSNPTCVASNPVDAVGFGTIFATVAVGVNPAMVSILQDGSRAYVVNAGNAAAGVEGSVTVVSLTSGTVTATIPALSTSVATSNSAPAYIYGHPNTVAATTGSPTGKVYVTSPDSRYMTVIQTDIDAVDTHIQLQGLGVRVLVNAP